MVRYGIGKLEKVLIAAVIFAWVVAGIASLYEAEPAHAQAFAAIQNSTSQGTSAGSHSVLGIAGPALFFGAQCTGQIGATTTPAAYCMVFDSATVPADGAVTPKYCTAMPASLAATAGGAATAVITAGGGQLPVGFANGIAVSLSTGANCATKTTSDGFNEFVSVNYN